MVEEREERSKEVKFVKEMWHFLCRLALVVAWLGFRRSCQGLWWIQKVRT